MVYRMSSAVRSLRAILVERGVRLQLRSGAFAEHLPGTRAVNAFAIHRHPIRDLRRGCCSSSASSSPEFGSGKFSSRLPLRLTMSHSISIDRLGRLVLRAALVVPVADAGVGLPGIGPDLVHDAALHVEHARADLAIFAAACWCRPPPPRRRSAGRSRCSDATPGAGRTLQTAAHRRCRAGRADIGPPGP